jgi:hypothetical protein
MFTATFCSIRVHTCKVRKVSILFHLQSTMYTTTTKNILSPFVFQTLCCKNNHFHHTVSCIHNTWKWNAVPQCNVYIHHTQSAVTQTAYCTHCSQDNLSSVLSQLQCESQAAFLPTETTNTCNFYLWQGWKTATEQPPVAS